MKKILYFIILLTIFLFSCTKEEEKIYKEIYINEKFDLPIQEKIINIYQDSIDIIYIENNKTIIGKKAGTANIRITLETKQLIYIIKVKESPDQIKEILSTFHNKQINKKENILVVGQKSYYTNIYQSVSNILYEELIINQDYLINNSKIFLDNVDFITIHFTANTDKLANAKQHAKYFKNNQNTSIHYIVGNDGIYQSTKENYVAYHTGAKSKMTWHKTNIKYQFEKEVKFGISSNGYFTINDKESIVKVPYESKKGYGYVNSGKWLNDYGVAYQIIDNEYYIGGTIWMYNQISEGRICSVGGNNNSIGIETCVNIGSNLWYTYHKTAKLVASLLIKYQLDISRVVPHQIFSGKNCPQVLLDNNKDLWNDFIELVHAEYIYLTSLKDVSIKFISKNKILAFNSMYLTYPMLNEEIAYSLIYNNKELSFISQSK